MIESDINMGEEVDGTVTTINNNLFVLVNFFGNNFSTKNQVFKCVFNQKYSENRI